ncbi:MAG: NAD(P)H-hydrate dehydratase [Prevotella sp.]|nr:NAD(P)H-hydrate dehydratase [Prevotella sp.]
MKIFTRSQIVELDRYTMEHEPIRSIDLMERSAKALTQAIMEMWSARTPIVVFAGPGNNGGDALAVARLLAEKDYQVSAYLFNISNHLSEDCIANQQRIKESKKVKEFVEVTTQFDPPVLEANMVVVDGLFGSGINKPLAGGFASLVKYINTSPSTIVSIDIPSGLMPEDNTYNISANTIKADYTLTLQQKKLAFLFADNQQFIGKLKVLDIRLSKDFINKTESQYYLTEENDVRSKIKERDDFAHKGTMGSALIIAGSYGMAGASILASRACLRSGAGKVVVHTPKKNYSIMQTAVPEAVMHMDHEETYFSQAIDTEDFEALGIGPGLGQQENSAIALISQIRRSTCPIVVDADALNMLASHRAWLQQLPKGIILTPHPKEFERIAGTACNGDYERLSKAQELAQNLQAYIILKGHYSALCMPNGRVIFNSTGNSGMATAGSGDVLTGIITALLARGYDQADACIVGMYLHGLAGDLAAKDKGKESLIAGDIIEYLPNAFKRLTE